MALDLTVPWHRESWNRFIDEYLPDLIEKQMPLSAYRVETQDTYTFSLKLAFDFAEGESQVEYRDLPQPDANGIFRIGGDYRVVVPYPAERDLAQAEIYCVGEQLLHFFQERLSHPPAHLKWDAEMVHVCLPVASWMMEFHSGMTSQYLQINNWLDRYTHMRRITLVPIEPEPLDPGPADVRAADRWNVFPREQLGWVCPYAQPEGPNIGRILEVARGVQIHGGKLTRVDDSPLGCLGFSASMVPFLEHDDTNRALMGVNMMRQWLAASDPDLPVHVSGWQEGSHERARQSKGKRPEPALVQTGEEPEAPDFWGGYNLLTAFVAWDGDGFDDGIVISESCARRLDFPQPIEVGDKLSTRHGSKGVISRILPDEAMPHLPDGTSVELIYSLTNLPSRMNFGQVREAVMGRIAHAEGRPAIVPPFQAPSDDKLKARLRAAGLPEDGLEQLTLQGRELPYRSTVGWVYWGRLFHTARRHLRPATEAGKTVGMLACRALLEVEAYANVYDIFNTNSAKRTGAVSLAGAGGLVLPASPPKPLFNRLQQVLQFAGIDAGMDGTQLAFSFAEPDGIALARPVPHPWSSTRELTAIGLLESLSDPTVEFGDLYESVLEANTRLERMLSSQAPDGLVTPALAQLQRRVGDLFAELLKPDDLLFQTRVIFAGSAVLAPGTELSWDQVGLADDLAWSFFGPRVVRELGPESVEKRTREATARLDEIMADSWVLLYGGKEILFDSDEFALNWVPQNPPSYCATALLAFRPVRHADRVIRIHTHVCSLMEQDFDGNQIGVILPLGDEAQREAGERLSLAGRLKHDPGLFDFVAHNYQGALWGLARLNFEDEGRAWLSETVGEDVPEGLLTKTYLSGLLKRVFVRDGAERALDVCDALMRRGFEVSRISGASFHPFFGAELKLPTPPAGDDAEEWSLYKEEIVAALLSEAQYDDDELGPIALLNRSGARTNRHQLSQYLGAQGPLYYRDDGALYVVRHNFREGLEPEELLHRTPGALRGLASANLRWMHGREDTDGGGGGHSPLIDDFHVLGRAMRSSTPGVVFARAADAGEIDPLDDPVARAFVGLEP